MNNTTNFTYTLLDKINNSNDLKCIPLSSLPDLCQEIRTFLLETLNEGGGHFASGLGAIELTVALHYCYETPFDQILWDVGHQAYPHKILTGRKSKLNTIKKLNGLHPFPWREESDYDVLSVGHSSTSISAGLGISIAAQKEGKGRKVVSVIGDGAITAGMAFEAMNHAGDIKPNYLVILNDNEMSISENVGALNKNLNRFLSGDLYSNFREDSKRLLNNIPPLKHFAKKAEEHIKGMVIPGTMFEELGFNYIGPVDGHDVLELVNIFSKIKKLKGPQFLHILTKKGKGFKPAEIDPIRYHAVNPNFNSSDIKQKPKKESKILSTYSEIFGKWLCDKASKNNKIVAITPAMKEGSGLVDFAQNYPEQFFDVAIAEQHAVTLSAGLAIGGLKPVVAIYSTFLQRGYDQLIHDVALMNLPVIFAIDRAGVVGPDGPTHQGMFDISFTRCIPNLCILTPSDKFSTLGLLDLCLTLKSPVCIRYPRGKALEYKKYKEKIKFEVGVSQTLHEGTKIAVLNFGSLLNTLENVCVKLNATLVDMLFVKPLDTAMLDRVIKEHDYIITVEDNVIKGGAGSAVIEYMMSTKNIKPTLQLGLPDNFIEQGSQEQIYKKLGLDSEGIIKKIKNYVNN
ncbi:1-deoxy-D-xylulose-5-phosphate synthase [Paraphotobacterium marinum]